MTDRTKVHQYEACRAESCCAGKRPHCLCGEAPEYALHTEVWI